MPVPFSSRTPGDFTPNPIAAALEARRARGESWIDCTESNPTRVGLPTPPRAAWLALVDGASAPYDPSPNGSASAREAVQAHLVSRGSSVPAQRILLTASTSEAYAHLFRMLCEPMDTVLVPEPSYPLFAPLARLEGVRAIPYPLVLDGDGWSIDRERLEAAVAPGARAVVVVHPNNPTGSLVGEEEARALEGLCATHDLALIADEVFADFVLPEHTRARRRATFAGASAVLTFTLGGLSKSCGLPQAKAAWIAVSGPDAEVERALTRLEWVADAFLSVTPAVQHALPELLRTRAPYLDATRARVRRNLAALDVAMRGIEDVERLPVEGGWSAIVRLPAQADDEAWTLRLLERGVLVQPGHFYDMDEESCVVLSLLPEPQAFGQGAQRLRAALEQSGL